MVLYHLGLFVNSQLCSLGAISGEKQWQSSQLWDGVQTKVIEPRIKCMLGNDDDVIRYFSMCKTCSKKLTANQQNNIPPTLHGAMSLIAGSLEDQCEHLTGTTALEIFSSLPNPVSSFKKDDVELKWAPLTFWNYFMVHNTVSDPPLQFVYNAEVIRSIFFELMENDDHSTHRDRIQAYRGDSKPEDKWNDFVSKIGKPFISLNYLAPNRRRAGKGNYDYMSLRLAWVMVALHASIFDYVRFANVARLFKPPDPTSLQVRPRPTYRQLSKIFTGFGWLEHCVWDVHRSIVPVVHSKIDFEHFIIRCLHTEKDDTEANKLLKQSMQRDQFNYDFSGWLPVASESQRMSKAWALGQDASFSKGLDTSSLRDRMKCLAVSLLFFDIVETLLRHGPDAQVADPVDGVKDNLAPYRKYIR